MLRPPPFALLLSVSVGTGTQLMLMALQQGQSAPVVVPEVALCASSGRA